MLGSTVVVAIVELRLHYCCVLLHCCTVVTVAAQQNYICVLFHSRLAEFFKGKGFRKHARMGACRCGLPRDSLNVSRRRAWPIDGHRTELVSVPSVDGEVVLVLRYCATLLVLFSQYPPP